MAVLNGMVVGAHLSMPTAPEATARAATALLPQAAIPMALLQRTRAASVKDTRRATTPDLHATQEASSREPPRLIRLKVCITTVGLVLIEYRIGHFSISFDRWWLRRGERFILRR